MPRQIRCPECDTRGALPEGYAKTRIRCPNPVCRHVFEISPGDGPAASTEVHPLADAAVPAGPVTDTVTWSPSASPPARPGALDAGKRPGQGTGEPASSLAGSDARRRTRWAAASAGVLALATVVVGIWAFTMRQDGGDAAPREPGKSARNEGGPPAPGGAPDAAAPPAGLGAAVPVAKNEPEIGKGAGGDMARAKPEGEAPQEDGLTAGSVAATAGEDRPPPAGPLPTEPPAPSPGLVAQPTPPDLEAEKAEADRVLRSKGLRRHDLVYVLDKEDNIRNLVIDLAATAQEVMAARGQMARLEAEAGQIQASLAQLWQQQQALIATDPGPFRDPAPDKPADPNANEADRKREQQRQQELRDQAWRQYQETASIRRQRWLHLENQIGQLQSTLLRAQSDHNRLVAYGTAKQIAWSRDRAALDALIGRIRKDYQDLGNDREVKAALSTLNRGSNRTHALGPIEDYPNNVKKMAGEVLAGKGFKPMRGGGIVLDVDEDLKRASSLVPTTRMALRMALHRYQSLQGEAASRMKQEADLAAREARTAAQLVAAAEPDKPKLTAELDRLRADLAKLRAEQAVGEKALKEVAQHVAAKRDSYVESVKNWGKAFDESRQKHEKIAHDDEAKGAGRTLGIKKGRGTKSASPKSDKNLEEARKQIQVEEVALVPDRAALWVTATVNGVQGLKLVLDPTVEAVRVAERFATTVGLIPAPGEAPVIVSVTTPDGQTIRARRATLQSVQVGSFKAHAVPCLVLLDAYDAPPVLGASFLDNYLVDIDTDANKLTLTRVDVPPYVPPRSGPSPKTPPGKAGSPRSGL